MKEEYILKYIFFSQCFYYLKKAYGLILFGKLIVVTEICVSKWGPPRTTRSLGHFLILW